MGTFTYSGKNFYKNGELHKVYAGAIHYFRVMPNSWREHLIKLKNIGFNAVETYICWSLHERSEGNFDFSGRLDFARFIDEAMELGLDVIIRPGPYICAEVDFGGMPSWLLNCPNIELRCDNEVFLEKVENYLNALAPILRPRFIQNGGNIIMMQIENEYGSYGNDEGYKIKLLDIYKRLCFDECLLCTADGNEPQMLLNGKFPEIMQGLTFGSHAKEMLEKQLIKNKQPDICVEFWNGWFDVYGENHHSRSAEEVCQEVRAFMESKASFSFYMFHGGTNFDMINGANYWDGVYRYQTTSYDYDAPLNEAGDRTEKYYLLKSLMEKLTGNKVDLPVTDSKKKAYAPIKADGFADLFDCLSEKAVLAPFPKTLEELGVDFGYALYSTKFHAVEDGELCLRKLRDRATVLIDGKIVASLDHQTCSKLTLTKSDVPVQIDILVENRGRCNYGYQLKDRKGILGGILYRQRILNSIISRPVKAILPEKLMYRIIQAADSKKIGYYHFSLDIAKGEVADTFLYPEGFTNGCVYVNGQNVGRYCNWQPPQRTLYVPAELLKEGKNDIVVFETDGTDNPTISFFEKHFYAEA